MRIFFAWYDLWIGAYYDRKAQALYICPLPMIVIQIGGQPHLPAVRDLFEDARHTTGPGRV